MPTYSTIPAVKGNVSGGPEKNQGKPAKDGGGRKTGQDVDMPTNKGPEKPEPEVGKGKKGVGAGIGLKGKMESLIKAWTLKS
jgi:hypothetical protein